MASHSRRVRLALVIAIAAGTACGSSSPATPSTATTPATPAVSPPPPAVTAPVALTDRQFKDRLEALILGSGPMAEAPNPGCGAFQNMFWRWASTLTTMSVLVTRDTSARERDQVTSVFEMYRKVLGGAPALDVQFLDTVPKFTPPTPPRGLITVDRLASLTPVCGREASGCSGMSGVNGVAVGGVIWIHEGAPDGTLSHEAGHVIGMCHIVGANPLETIMNGATSPTQLDHDVLEKVIRSGLSPGATRADFVAKGLL